MGFFDSFKRQPPNVIGLKQNQDVKALAKALRNNDPKIRREAATALGEIG
jgi:HEAT repeat protein